MIKQKHKVYKLYTKVKKGPIKDDLFKTYKSLKNNLLNSTRTKKKEYYQQYFLEHRKNMKKVWNGIKSIINIKSKSFDTPTCIEANGSTITDTKQISNSFNDFVHQ